MVKTKIPLLIGAILLATACAKRTPVTKWHNPNAIGPYSVLVNRPDGTAYIFNPQNHEIEEEPQGRSGKTTPNGPHSRGEPAGTTVTDTAQMRPQVLPLLKERP